MALETIGLPADMLNWAVALVEGYDREWLRKQLTNPNPATRAIPQFATDWDVSGPIIERRGISIIRANDAYGSDERGYCNNVRIPVWCATLGQNEVQTSVDHQHHEPMFQIDEREVLYGPTPLIAALRCHVVTTLGRVLDAV